MAATFSFLNQPYNFNPINANTYIVAYSDDYNLQNFSYVYSLYTYNRLVASQSNFLGQYKIPPRPTGEGVFDVHKILKSSVVNEYNFPMSVITSATFSLIPVTDETCLSKFNYTYGFEEYIGFTFSGTYNIGGYVALQGTSGKFNIGDKLTIQMTGSSSNTNYNGTQTVLGFTNSDAYTNKTFGITESNTTGQVTIFDRTLGTSSTFYGINGTRQYYNANINSISNQSGLFDVYNYGNFIIPPPSAVDGGSASSTFTVIIDGGTSSSTYSGVINSGYSANKYNFLTNYNAPDAGYYKDIFLNQYETISVLCHTQSAYKLTITTYDVNFNQINSVTSSTYSLPNDYILYNLPIGTANLSSTISFATASYYNITMNIGSDFYLVRRHIKSNSSVYPNVRLMFLNRLGGWDYYNFDYDSKYSTTINRTSYQKTLDWNYNIGDRGSSVLAIQANTQVIANTDWITEYDYNYLQELFTSPNVFVIDEVTLVKIPIVIVDTTWTQETLLRDKIFNCSITYQYAYDINLQSN
jgi:hypothetical protein